MEIIIGLAIVLVVIGILAFLRGDSNADDEYERWERWKELVDIKFKMSMLETENKHLRSWYEHLSKEIREVKQKTVYQGSKDLKQLEISNSLKSVISNLEQIVKKV